MDDPYENYENNEETTVLPEVHVSVEESITFDNF